MLISLDPDQARRSVGPDLGPNCLQKLSADNTRRGHWPFNPNKSALIFINPLSALYVKMCTFLSCIGTLRITCIVLLFLEYMRASG